MSELATTGEYLGYVLQELACAAASGAAYEKWSDEFARDEVREVWHDAPAPLRKPRDRRVTILELRELSDRDRQLLGFRKWDENLVTIPLWAFNYIADGEVLTSIQGDTKIKGKDEIDLDHRGGCIAWGWSPLERGAEQPT